jgi:thiol-disulfide isomerase/thioredoxin
MFTNFKLPATILVLGIVGAGITALLSSPQARGLDEPVRKTKLPAQLKFPLENPYAAPELAGISKWLNTKEPTLKDVEGKVVLVHFFACGCINCIRTFPHVTAWHKEFKDKDLVIIGIHTPETASEKKLETLEAALVKYKINYTVGLDNEYKTWNNYKNEWWPAIYLINKKGQVVYTHFGEGNYQETKYNINKLLAE